MGRIQRHRLATAGVGLILALLLLAALGPFGSSAQGQTLHWDRYDVIIDLHEDGTFTVTEEQHINFTSGTFREGFAVIPLDRVEDISNIQVHGPAV